MLVHQVEHAVKIEGKILAQGLAARLHPADLPLDGINAEAGPAADQIIPPGHGQYPDEQVQYFVRTVAHHYLRGVHLMAAAQGGGQARVAALRIAEGPLRVTADGRHGQGRRAQGIFVAGQLNDLGKTVFFLNFCNGKAGHIGLEPGNFRPDAAGGHGNSSLAEQRQAPGGRGPEQKRTSAQAAVRATSK